MLSPARWEIRRHTVAEVAERAGVSPRTMLRRLRALHERHGGVLESDSTKGSVRKWWVSALGLRLLAGERSASLNDRIDALERRIEDLETQVAAGRKLQRKLRTDLRRALGHGES